MSWRRRIAPTAVESTDAGLPGVITVERKAMTCAGVRGKLTEYCKNLQIRNPMARKGFDRDLTI